MGLFLFIFENWLIILYFRAFVGEKYVQDVYKWNQKLKLYLDKYQILNV